MTGGRPSLMASCACQFALVMHSAACVASSGLRPVFGMPRFAPPIETRLGSPLLAPGQREVAPSLMICGALTAASLGAGRPSALTIVPPAEETRLLNQTT